MALRKITWTDLKALITKKRAAVQYEEKDLYYCVWIVDGADEYMTKIKKSDPASSDQTDFETNYQPKANEKTAIQTTPFAAGKVEFDGRGSKGTVTAGLIENVDYLVTDEMLINGGLIYFHNGVAGDTFTCQIVDKDGVYYPAGTVLKQWITDWNVFPNIKQDLTTPQAGTIPALVYLRVVYTSTGIVDVDVLVNYKLNKDLG